MKIHRRFWIVIPALLVAGVSVIGFAGYFRTSPALLFETTLSAIEAGNTALASEGISRLREYPEWSDECRLLRGMSYLRQNRVEESLRLLAQLDQSGRHRSLILLTAGECLYKLGRFGEAAKSLEIVVRETPENLMAHRWLSSAYYDLGAFDASIVSLKAIVRLAPDDYRPHHLLAVIYSDFEQHAEAISHCEAALGLKCPAEKESEIRIKLAENLLALHEYARTLQVLDRVPETSKSVYLCAASQWYLGQSSIATALLEKAKQLGESSPELALLESEIADETGETSRAIEVLQSAVARFPDHAELHYPLALKLRKSGQEQQADLEMQRWEIRKSLVEKLTELNLVAVGSPYDGKVRDELAEICRQLGKTELAKMWAAAAESCRMAESSK